MKELGEAEPLGKYETKIKKLCNMVLKQIEQLEKEEAITKEQKRSSSYNRQFLRHTRSLGLMLLSPLVYTDEYINKEKLVSTLPF